MKIFFLFFFLAHHSCFSMELNYPEKQIPIFSNNSNQPIFLDKSIIEYSKFLKTLLATRKEYASENIKFDFNHEDLKCTIDIINLFLEIQKDSSKENILEHALQELSLQDLINTYYMADCFMMNELKEILSPLFNNPEFIKELSQLDKEQLQALEIIKTSNFLLSKKPEPLLKNVDWIKCSPDGSQYFVRFNDGTGQLFDSEGNSIGSTLSNVFLISWSPNGKYYFAQFINNEVITNEAQLFDSEGNSIGGNLENIISINWLPDSSKYFILFNDYTGCIYNIENNLLERFNNVWYISWSPNSLYYFIVYNDAVTI